MASPLDPDEQAHPYNPQYHYPHLLPLHNRHHQQQQHQQLHQFHQQQMPMHQQQQHKFPKQIRESRPNSSSLPPLSSRNDSFPLQLAPSRQASRHDESSASRHNWQPSLKQDGSSVSQAVTACKDSDLEAAELSQARGQADVVRQKYIGQLSIELDQKINKRTIMPTGNPIRVCRFCNREFPSGRALGGHMRVHGALFAGTVAATLTVDADDNEQKQQEFTASIARSSSSRPADYLTGNSNSNKKDHISRSKERRFSGSEFQTGKALLFGESAMGELGIEEDARSERVSFSSETDSDDDQFIDDTVIPSSLRKEHSLGSLEFTSNHESQPNDEVLDDGMISSEGKTNPLYRLRRNPKRSRRFTDQEFALEVLAANPATAFSAKRSGSASPERARPCSECGKVFWSWKALFGHMRCHPEREWRGIQPPESSSLEVERAGLRKRSPVEYSFADNSELELESDVENKEDAERELSFKIPIREEASTIRGELETTTTQEKRNEGGDAEDLTIVKKGGDRRSAESILKEFMDDWTPHWPTGKRSKRRRPRATGFQMQTSSTEIALISETTSNELENQEDLDMANCLVMLSAAGTRLEELERNSVESTEESAFSSDSGRNQTPQHDAREDSEQDVEVVDDADLCEYVDTVNDAFFASSGLKYECSTCKRCFNSHQALGGHRASHRKTKGCFARTNPSEEVHDSGEENMIDEEFISSKVNKLQMQLAVPVEDERASILHSFNATTKDKAPAKQQLKGPGHECSICHRVFTSGQALGGHKRCHWTGEKIAETASVASSNNKQSSLSCGGQTKQIKEDAIDLNLPAPLDEDDEAGYGSTEVAPIYGRLMETSKDEQIVGALMEFPHKLSSVSGDWAVKNLFKGNGDSLWGEAGRELLEASCGFDGRPGIWGQQWSTGAAAQAPQIYSMQPL